MKKLFGSVFLLLIFISLIGFTSTKPDTMHTIEGTWELQSFYNFDGQDIVDTLLTDVGYRQVKMYYNGRIMWSRTTAEDTKDADGNDVVGKFGYGTYRITDNQLIEVIEYGDEGMLTGKDSVRTFVFELWLKDDMYSQINIDGEGNRIFSENYKRID
ncbi:hypothetical protein [Maribacter sp. HTCC2170]|uniref:hypothetical protein n=1 Tax=Maribacter sp. (strain HTCC2170 / KCCM 42371) TaxID=313603 RepID=UPI00006B4822|nr:hypothetical protein [Maribacter sp. HTCC2170]EAR01728.1 hypothetical protein FB2170_14408 [Maribacter sp. HTCC2170]